MQHRTSVGPTALLAHSHCLLWNLLRTVAIFWHVLLFTGTFRVLYPRTVHLSGRHLETLVLRRRSCGRPVCWWGTLHLLTCILAGCWCEWSDPGRLQTAIDVRQASTSDSPTRCIYDIKFNPPTRTTLSHNLPIDGLTVTRIKCILI